MGRPREEGLEFFGMPVDMFDWDELHFVLAKHGLAARGILSSLINALFSVGYCFKWDQKSRVIFADKIRAPLELVEAVVSDAVNEGFFSENLLKSHQILTAKWIQELYENATRKRSRVEMRRDWLLITPKNANISVIEPKTPVSAPQPGPKPQLRLEETPTIRGEEIRLEDSINISSEGSDSSPPDLSIPPTDEPRVPPESTPDPFLELAESKLDTPNDQPWTRTNAFINAGRRPLKAFPNLFFTTHELADVFRDYVESEIPERYRRKAFEVARDQVTTHRARGQPDTSHAGMLRGWIKNQILGEWLAEERVKKVRVA